MPPRVATARLQPRRPPASANLPNKAVPCLLASNPSQKLESRSSLKGNPLSDSVSSDSALVMRTILALGMAGLLAAPAFAADMPTLTQDSGAPVGDNQHSKAAGPDGGVLLEDFHLIEKLARFDRERIPERVVHARGTGAQGSF